MRRADSVRNAVERTLEYSRPLRSLKLWLAFRTHGAAAFRGWIERTLALAGEFAEAIREAPEFELICEPTLSTVCFRHLAGGGDLDSTTSSWRPRSSATGASTWPRRSSTARPVCGSASSTSGPAPRTSASRCEVLRELGTRTADQAGASRTGIRLMPLKKFDCRRSTGPVSSNRADALDHLLEDDLDLEPGEVGAGAEVGAAGAEGHLPVRVAADVEARRGRRTPPRRSCRR